MKNFKISEKTISIFVSCFIYTVAIITQIVIKPTTNIWYAAITLFAILLEAVAQRIKSLYNRSDEIQKIFQKCSEKEKEEIYDYVKKYDKK